MISYYLSLIIAYILGGLTFIPILLLSAYLLNRKNRAIPKVTLSNALEEEKQEEITSQQGQFYKVGWLNVTRNQKLVNKSTSIGNIVKSYLSGNNGNSSSNNLNEVSSATNVKENNATYFAVLKFNTLYLYDSELQLDCKTIINISNYNVQIYPYGLKDFELFSKVNRIQLKKRKSLISSDHMEKDFYLSTSRCVDKEDWYFALKRASKLNLTSSLQHGEPASKDLQSSLYNSTHFDQDAMNHLISTIHSDPAHFETQWLNALLGRIFLGIYKTQSTKSFFYNKILSKIAKLNARRPPFLEEITLRSVHGGHGPPYITHPRLVHLSPQGEYTGDAHLFYDGHFRVELETVLTWKYSDRLPPIRIDLVLAITLKSIEGKIMFKIKEPPTNRAWLGFYKKPKMEWIVEPLVWEKRMGYSMVSKAIQTKIEEIIAETMVLPNMDDMVFFQTEGVGGIYGEEDNYGKPETKTAFDLDGNNKQKKESEKKPVTSDIMSNISYQSLPELYSAPSELVITADPFPLLTTSTSSTIAPPKKSWFKRKNTISMDYHQSTNASDNESNQENHSCAIIPLDTPSQQTLKSVITPIFEKENNKKAKMKRKKSIINTNNGNRPQFLATNVDHSIQSLISSNSAATSAETLTVQNSLLHNKPTNNSTINVDSNMARNPNIDALHSIRLSKKMLLMGDLQPSRLRSKSLPSTGLSIDVAQMGDRKN
ncbi:unnamed protein product [Mucor hiemalis]